MQEYNEKILSALYSGSSTLDSPNVILCTENRRLNTYGALEQLENHNINYIQYSSTHHQLYCFDCSGYFIQEHEWELRQVNTLKAIIDPISWICNRCGVSQL